MILPSLLSLGTSTGLYLRSLPILKTIVFNNFKINILITGCLFTTSTIKWQWHLYFAAYCSTVKPFKPVQFLLMIFFCFIRTMLKKKENFFSSSTEAFFQCNCTQCNCTPIGPVLKNEPMAWRRCESLWLCSLPNRWGVWLYKRPLCRHISDFFSLATKTLPRWLFADTEICRWNASAARLDLLQWPACRFGWSPASI